MTAADRAPAPRAAAIGTPAAKSTSAAAQLRDVTKTYGEGAVAVHALAGIDLDIRSGEFVVLLGPSGSGKTTLLNLIGGIESASSGRIVVAGRALDDLDEAGRTAYRRDVVGFVFQFFNLIPTLTARENVELVAALGDRRDGAGAAEILRRVGLGDRIDHFPAQLSGGEQQRVAVARALARRPSLLLADEPTGALDLETGRAVLGLLRDIAAELGQTVLLVTHNATIARMADRVLHLRDGRLTRDEANPQPMSADSLDW